MSIKSEYKKARANYLARVRYQESLGYQVERIALPKKPTRASINRLNKQTAKEIRNKSTLVDVSTGEIVKPKRKSERQAIQKKNKAFTKVAKEIEKAITKDRRRRSSKTNIEERQRSIIDIPYDFDIAIQNLYENIEYFIPPLRELIKARVDALLGDNSIERRKALGRVISENPDYVPTPQDSDRTRVEHKFAELSRLLKMEIDSKEFQEITDLTDDVEDEE